MTAEKKLVVVFCYYVVIAVFTLTSFTLLTRNSTQFVSSVEQNFLCEQGGHNPSNPCSLSDIESLSYPAVNTLTYILIALLPFVNLLYTVNIQELKELWAKFFKHKLSV